MAQGAIRIQRKRGDVRMVLTVLLMLVTTPTFAEWMQVGEPDEGVYYLDPATISKDGRLRRISELINLTARDRDGGLSRRYLKEYDCKQKRLRLLSGSTNSGPMATGKALFSVNNPGKWNDVPSDTIAETIFKFACSR